MKQKPLKCLLLAAGLGTRLRPYTDTLPKCLMPVGGKPLLEIWLESLEKIDHSGILVNTHYLHEQVEAFLARDRFQSKIKYVYEPKLLGTAGTLQFNSEFFKDSTILLIHADNLCLCDFENFVDFHLKQRPKGTLMTMMTFVTESPQTCGIVELDSNGVVQGFHEKKINPPGNIANAAIYLLEPQVLEFLLEKKDISDLSTQLIPEFVGKIATWKNDRVLRDIGSPESLRQAQNEYKLNESNLIDSWTEEFLKHPIHSFIKERSS